MSRLLLNTVIYNRDLVPLGGVVCAVYLSTLLSHYREWATADGWMHQNIDQIEHLSGLVPEEQLIARIALREMGVIRDGMAFDEPAMCLDLFRLDELMTGAGK